MWSLTEPIESLIFAPPSQPPALTHGTIHLWLIDTVAADPQEPQDLDRALALLGEAQRLRAQRMAHPGHRERYIRAQSGLRRVLGLYLNSPPAALGFRLGPAGKPELAPGLGLGPQIHFNLTTTADLALVALSVDRELGVDCEWIRPRRNLESVARRMFEPAVCQALADLPELERPAAFYRAWTALEADAKCDGRGLFRPRDSAVPVPCIRHGHPALGHVLALAQVDLPPPSAWETFALGNAD